MGCNCNKTHNISMGCCVPTLGPIENYYTKYQTDLRIEEEISGLTGSSSGCCITPEEVDEKISVATDDMATEQWVEDKHYITGVDLSDYALKSDIPTVPTSNTAFTNDAGYLTEHQSLSGYATEQWVEDQGYLTDADYPDLTGYATKEWVINQNYVSNSELIQYITNLQNQIDSLRAEISGCCSDTGETITRWITMTGASDYTCSGTTKYTKEKEQQSTDGGNTWSDTGNYRSGSTVLEENSVDCGYIAPLKFKGILRNGGETKVECNSSSILTKEEVYTTRSYSSITIGDCVSSIGERAFINGIYITSVTIPSGVTSISENAFADVGNNTGVTNFTITLNEGLITIGEGAFYGCRNYSSLVIPNSVQTIGDGAFYGNKINTLVIGSGVTSINATSFQRTSLSGSTITVLATTPPTIVNKYNAFSGWDNAPIYVPAASVNTYKAASGWSRYADRIQAIS